MPMVFLDVPLFKVYTKVSKKLAEVRYLGALQVNGKIMQHFPFASDLTHVITE